MCFLVRTNNNIDFLTILQNSKFASRNFLAQKSVEFKQNRTFLFFNSFFLDFMLPSSEFKISKYQNFQFID